MMVTQLDVNTFLSKRVEIRKEFGATLTNLWLTPEELQEAWTKGLLKIIQVENTYVLILQEGRINKLYYLTPSATELERILSDKRFLDGREVLLEEITRSSENKSQRKPDMILNMMQKNMAENAEVVESDIKTDKATTEDIEQIERLLCENFSPKLERIPTLDTLKNWCKDSGIFVFRESGRILGMILFTQKNSTIHLEYWWIDPSVRGRGIGSALMKRFFEAGKDCKNATLWVDINNRNAIERYEHLKFKPVARFDHIYLIK